MFSHYLQISYYIPIQLCTGTNIKNNNKKTTWKTIGGFIFTGPFDKSFYVDSHQLVIKTQFWWTTVTVILLKV